MQDSSLSLRMNKCLERVNDRHYWNPGVLSYAMIPRCRPNSRVFRSRRHNSRFAAFTPFVPPQVVEGVVARVPNTSRGVKTSASSRLRASRTRGCRRNLRSLVQVEEGVARGRATAGSSSSVHFPVRPLRRKLPWPPLVSIWRPRRTRCLNSSTCSTSSRSETLQKSMSQDSNVRQTFSHAIVQVVLCCSCKLILES